MLLLVVVYPSFPKNLGRYLGHSGPLCPTGPTGDDNDAIAQNAGEGKYDLTTHLYRSATKGSKVHSTRQIIERF